MYKIDEVVQFNENHKWCGCFGTIEEVTECSNGDYKYLIGVPTPDGGIAYIFSRDSARELEYIGKAVLIIK